MVLIEAVFLFHNFLRLIHTSQILGKTLRPGHGRMRTSSYKMYTPIPFLAPDGQRTVHVPGAAIIYMDQPLLVKPLVYFKQALP